MKLNAMTILSIILLSGCAYQSGVLADRDAEKTTKPSAGATTVDAPHTAPANTAPVRPTTNAQKMISPLTGG
jgi:PBP1b-binding outer membrane lipoprotein LpoB